VRCVACWRQAEAYLCEACSWVSDYHTARINSHEVRASSPTAVGRAMRRRQERDVEAGHLRALQSARWGTDETERLIRLRTEALDPRLTRDEVDNLRTLLPGRVGPTGQYASKRLRKAQRTG
jgi:hypothetical protein